MCYNFFRKIINIVTNMDFGKCEGCEKMPKVIVDKKSCPQDHKCPAIKVCPVEAIRQDNFGLPYIDYDKCILCQKCTMFCPKGALQVEY